MLFFLYWKLEVKIRNTITRCIVSSVLEKSFLCFLKLVTFHLSKKRASHLDTAHDIKQTRLLFIGRRNVFWNTRFFLYQYLIVLSLVRTDDVMMTSGDKPSYWLTRGISVNEFVFGKIKRDRHMISCFGRRKQKKTKQTK